ncbi:hypothetical protein C8J56DRAFT_903665 [Mycena floridula]|nr:hypothetical protein C8J56DRAFT_903665 [Mycena floridula]
MNAAHVIQRNNWPNREITIQKHILPLLQDWAKIAPITCLPRGSPATGHNLCLFTYSEPENPVYDPDHHGDGNCVILINDTLFKIHTAFFARDKSMFMNMFRNAEPSGPLSQNTTDKDPLPIPLETQQEQTVNDPTCVISEMYSDEIIVIDVFRAIIRQMKSVLEQASPPCYGFHAHDLLAHLRAQECLDDVGVGAHKIQIRGLFITEPMAENAKASLHLTDSFTWDAQI